MGCNAQENNPLRITVFIVSIQNQLRRGNGYYLIDLLFLIYIYIYIYIYTSIFASKQPLTLYFFYFVIETLFFRVHFLNISLG